MFSWSSLAAARASCLNRRHALRVAGGFGRQDLQRDDAAEFGVAGLQHRGHAADADGLDQFEVPQPAAGDRRRLAGNHQRAGRWRGSVRLVLGDDGGRVVGVGGPALRVGEELRDVRLGRRLVRRAALADEVGERVVGGVRPGGPAGGREREFARRVRRRGRRGGFGRGRASGRVGRRKHFGSHSAAGEGPHDSGCPALKNVGRRTAPASGRRRLFLPGRQRASGPRARFANGVVPQL